MALYRVNCGSLQIQGITYGIGDQITIEPKAAEPYAKIGQLLLLSAPADDVEEKEEKTVRKLSPEMTLRGSDVAVLSRIADDPPKKSSLIELLATAKARRRSLTLQQALRALIAISPK